MVQAELCGIILLIFFGEAVKKVIRNQPENPSVYHNECLDVYKMHIGMNLKEGTFQPVAELADLLDGAYWRIRAQEE